MLTRALLAAALAAAILPAPVGAGVTNPDISVIGQPFAAWTNDAADADRNRLKFDAGETEFVFDAYLNPYARGTFVLALGEEGMELEEGYFHLFRSLPLGLALKGGKYRAGFGRMNPVHPHALPFAERFQVLSTFLPGEESLNETGVSISDRIPVRGEFSLNASLDVFEGGSFRVEREPGESPDDPLALGGDDLAGESRPALLGRVSGFTMLGEQSALEFGVSAAGGTNNVAARSRTKVYGVDAKAKLWTSPRAYLVLQAEALRLDREEATWSPEEGYAHAGVTPAGGYLYADYNFKIRYNLGASYERYQEPTPEEPWSEAVGAFAGYSLLEETTAFRADVVRFLPAGGDASTRFTLRVVYSMGPHKAHTF
jgi:hypothetical protein